MRPLWFDHLEEMWTKVDSSKLEVWGRGDIEQLFRVKRSAALNIMDAIDREGRSQNPRQIEKAPLLSFLQDFRDIVLPVGTDKRKRRGAIKNADELLRKKSSAGVPAQAAQTPPSSNQDTDAVLAKPLVIEIDQAYASRLDQMEIELFKQAYASLLDQMKIEVIEQASANLLDQMKIKLHLSRSQIVMQAIDHYSKKLDKDSQKRARGENAKLKEAGHVEDSSNYRLE